jgi:hypothetical protein
MSGLTMILEVSLLLPYTLNFQLEFLYRVYFAVDGVHEFQNINVCISSDYESARAHLLRCNICVSV